MYPITKYRLLLPLIPVICFSCFPSDEEERTGIFPETAVNFSTFNTEFDDYNSAMPFFPDVAPFCFSSNRNSNGRDYDIVYKLVKFDVSKEDGTPDISEQKDGLGNGNVQWSLNKANTEFNELGPGLYFPDGSGEACLLWYSNDAGGHQDIWFTHNLEEESYSDPKPVAFLNSEFDDAYPTLDRFQTQIYFTSDREGDFDIYRAGTGTGASLMDKLGDSLEVTIRTVSSLCSEADDKCPFILDNLLVFTSNRPGGFGGFDLYYSTYQNGEWTDPVNFGDRINTEYDEYRPIVRPVNNFSNDFMLFSSDRPGGKGGFDLYYVGI